MCIVCMYDPIWIHVYIYKTYDEQSIYNNLHGSTKCCKYEKFTLTKLQCKQQSQNTMESKSNEIK